MWRKWNYKSQQLLRDIQSRGGILLTQGTMMGKTGVPLDRSVLAQGTWCAHKILFHALSLWSWSLAVPAVGRGKERTADGDGGQPWRLGSLLSHHRVMKGLGDKHQDTPAHSCNPQPPLGTGKGGTRPQLFCHRKKTAAQGNGFFCLHWGWPSGQTSPHVHTLSCKRSWVLYQHWLHRLHVAVILPTPPANAGGRERAPTLGSTSVSSTHPNLCALPLCTTIPFEWIQIFMRLAQTSSTCLQHHGYLCSDPLLPG